MQSFNGLLFEVPSGDEKAITKILGLSTIADFAAHFCNYLASVPLAQRHSSIRCYGRSRPAAEHGTRLRVRGPLKTLVKSEF
jgi:hypothetical protein